MKARELISQMENQAVLSVGREDFNALLEVSDTIRAADTCLAGLIRVISFEHEIVIQEETPNGEVLLRKADSKEAADQFVDDRLAVYERMWDGCGCKVDYHN